MRITRPLAVLAATALVTGLSITPAQAASPYDGKPGRAGAAWLVGELTDGLVHNEQYDFDDVGLSIDVALGIHATGRRPHVVKTLANAVAHRVGSYTTFAPSVYAGPTAKAAVLAQSTGRNPRAFGGLDLIAQLEGLVSSAAPIAGRVEDAYDPADPFGGDFANVIGQAYAAQALALAGSGKASAVRNFLLEQQCAKGYFRQYFTTDKTRADQSCSGAPAAERGASVDATALAVVALQDVKGSAAKAAVKRAVAWLVDRQRADGALSDTGKKSGAYNTNSTGLAGWAIAIGGNAKQKAAVKKAAVWVRALQVPAKNPCSRKLGKDAGAIAYDASAYRKGQRNGIKATKSDQWRRASAQALPVLQWAPRAAGEFTAKAAGPARAGEGLTIRLTGVAAGQRVCVTEGQFAYEALPGRNPLTQVRFVLDARTGLRTFKVWLGDVRRDVTVRVTH